MAGRPEHTGNGYAPTVTASSTRALDLVIRGGVAHTVHEYELPEARGRGRGERPHYGVQAADVLGVEPGRVFKTLVAAVDDRLVLAVVPADRDLDLKALARVGTGRRALLADPAVAERATGYVVGGISPLGSRRPLPVVIDETAFEHATILVSAGQRGLQLELAAADLVRLCSARSAAIAKDQGPG